MSEWDLLSRYKGLYWASFLHIVKDGSDNPNRFQSILKDSLYVNSFYSVDEYFQFHKLNISRFFIIC